MQEERSDPMENATDLVLMLLCVAPLIIHLQDDFLQFLLGASHQLGGGLPLPESKDNRYKSAGSIHPEHKALKLH